MLIIVANEKLLADLVMLSCSEGAMSLCLYIPSVAYVVVAPAKQTWSEAKQKFKIFFSLPFLKVDEGPHIYLAGTIPLSMLQIQLIFLLMELKFLFQIF